MHTLHYLYFQPIKYVTLKGFIDREIIETNADAVNYRYKFM